MKSVFTLNGCMNRIQKKKILGKVPYENKAYLINLPTNTIFMKIDGYEFLMSI